MRRDAKERLAHTSHFGLKAQDAVSILPQYNIKRSFTPARLKKAVRLMSLDRSLVLGPYELVAPIGKGGMGEVYRARDTRLGRDVAIKICGERFSERFEREARVIASLNHPNICHLYDVGPNYLVMELVDGQTLKGPLPLETALNYARQIADALDAAHEKGIVHRDLKPANIKINRDGVVKVLDFGLAKAADERGDASDPDKSPTIITSQTHAGVILGTAAYMSPEQARGAVVDKRADIWAFGCVLYEMLAGKPAFQGETTSDIVAAVLREEPDWSRVPTTVQPLLRRCLVKDPKHRLRDIGDAMALIESAPEVARGRSPAAWRWAAVALACALAIVVTVSRRSNNTPIRPDAPVRFQIPLPEKSLFGSSLALSPDGRLLAFNAIEVDGTNHLWMRALDSFASKPLPAEVDATDIGWMPQSRSLVYRAVADNSIRRLALDGGSPETLGQPPQDALGLDVSADESILVGTLNSGIFRLPADGGVAAPVTKPDRAKQETYHTQPQFLPDERHFLYLVNSNRPEVSGIYVARLGSGNVAVESRRLTAARSKAIYVPATEPDHGHLLFMRGSTLMAQAFDADRLELSGDAYTIAEHVGALFTRGDFSASHNGTLAYWPGDESSRLQPAWLDRTGKSSEFPNLGVSYTELSLSPDGARVCGVGRDSQSATNKLFVLDLRRGTLEWLTFGLTPASNPAWSPDGRRLAYALLNAGGVLQIYSRDSSGGGHETALLRSEDSTRPYSWSPDSRFLLYGREPVNGKRELWILPLDGDHKPRPYLQSEFNATQAQFSPDGKYIAYVSDETGQPDVYVQQFPQEASGTGGKWRISRHGGRQPRWRADGKEIYYQAADQMLMAVSIQASPAFNCGEPHRLFGATMRRGSGVTSFAYSPSRDGSRFLIINGAPTGADPITVVLNWTAGLKK